LGVTYRATIKNGVVVVLPPDTQLPDGTTVRVEPGGVDLPSRCIEQA
jgi:hypothetical protein